MYEVPGGQDAAMAESVGAGPIGAAMTSVLLVSAKLAKNKILHVAWRHKYFNRIVRKMTLKELEREKIVSSRPSLMGIMSRTLRRPPHVQLEIPQPCSTCSATLQTKYRHHSAAKRMRSHRVCQFCSRSSQVLHACAAAGPTSLQVRENVQERVGCCITEEEL